MTTQGHPRAIFRRAVETGNLLAAETVARELGRVTLDESLALTALVAQKDPGRRSRYAVRWLRRLLEEDAKLTIEETGCLQSKLDETREIRPFASWDDVDAISAELVDRYKPIPVVLVGTGLRPEEVYRLEWRDYDRANAVLGVERVFTQGVLKPCAKSDQQRRRA